MKIDAENDAKLFVWDFHGTLEFGNDGAVLEITNLILEQQGYSRRMTMDEASILSGRRWHEYFAFLLPELETEHCLNLQKNCISISQRHPEIIARNIKPSPNATEVLEAIDKSPHTQIVLSNTQPKSLDIFLQSVNMEHYFPSHHRIGADAHCQKRVTKKDWLNDFLKDRDFPGGIVAIGDSPGDVELAECHPKGIGYLFSHPGRPHREAACGYKINDLKHILRELVLCK